MTRSQLVWRAVGKNNARFIAGYPRTALPQFITTEGEIAKDRVDAKRLFRADDLRETTLLRKTDTSLHRSEMTRWANNGRERMQQWMHQNAGYSITSSARASSIGGTSWPSDFAILRLITSSSFVGCSTGRLAGR